MNKIAPYDANKKQLSHWTNNFDVLIKVTLDDINSTFKNVSDDVIQKIDASIDLFVSSCLTEHHEESIVQEKIFKRITSFFNTLFADVEVKKLYNTIPNMTMRAYADKSLWHQFLNNVYGKDWQLFYTDDIQWGGCHHWTIFFKKIFDRFEFLHTKIYFDPIRPASHSFLVVECAWKHYFADVYGFNQPLGHVISSVEELNTLYNTTGFSLYSTPKKIPKHLKSYPTINEFTIFLDNRKTTSAVIEFKPKFSENDQFNIKIEFFTGKIFLAVGNIVYS